MSTDVGNEIAVAFEAGYADEPGPRPAAAYLAGGRRRLRRRRLSAGATTVVLIVAVALAGSLVRGGGSSPSTPDGTPVVDSSAPSPPATTPPGSVPEPAPPERISDVLVRGQHAGYDGQGRVVLRPGWRVVREVPNPLRKVSPEASLGVVVTNGRHTEWYLLEHTADGGGASWDRASKAYARFEQWLDTMVDLQRGDEPEPFVGFARSGEVLEAGVGVRILRQWRHPDLPGFAAPGDDSAAAKVEADGRVYFVLARRAPGGPADTIPVDAGVLPEPTYDAFLAYARDRYATGEGLR